MPLAPAPWALAVWLFLRGKVQCRPAVLSLFGPVLAFRLAAERWNLPLRTLARLV